MTVNSLNIDGLHCLLIIFVIALMRIKFVTAIVFVIAFMRIPIGTAIVFVLVHMSIPIALIALIRIPIATAIVFDVLDSIIDIFNGIDDHQGETHTLIVS